MIARGVDSKAIGRPIRGCKNGRSIGLERVGNTVALVSRADRAQRRRVDRVGDERRRGIRKYEHRAAWMSTSPGFDAIVLTAHGASHASGRLLVDRDLAPARTSQY